MAQTNVQAFSGDVEIADGLTVSKDIESTNSFITERVLFKETWPNGHNSLAGDLGTWVVTNANQQSNPSITTTPDGYTLVAINGDDSANGEFVSPAFDLSDYALSDGVLPADDKRKTTTRVFLKCFFGTRQLDDSGEVAQVQFSPDNGSTWYTVATSQDRNDADRFTMVSADLSPYILETSTNAKIRFYMPWTVAGGDYMRIGRIWIHESDVPTNLGGMWLGAGGKVGIGTTIPGETLSIYKEDTTAAGETVLSSITGVFSGSDAVTGGNINNKGLFIDLDSSATGGTETNSEEHRVWGIDVDIDVTGDSDDIRGGRFLVRSELAENGTDKNTNIYGIDAQGQNNGSAPNTNIIGVNGKSLKSTGSTGLTDIMIGVRAEYEINNGTCTDAYGVRAQFDRNGGAATNSYLFFGDHAGSTTTITNNYGLYVASADKHYLEGNVGIGTNDPVGVNGGQRLEGSSTGGFEYIATRSQSSIGDGSFIGGYLFKNDDTAGTTPHYAGMTGYGSGANGNMQLRFFAGRDVYEDTPLEPHMIIDKSRNVGIGTDAPQGNLHISSGTSGDCVLILEADTDNNEEDDNPRIEFRQDGGIAPSAILQTDNYLEFKNSTTVRGGMRFFTGGDTNGFENATERMHIDENGNVGIGTASPECMLHLSASTASADITDPIILKINNRRGAGDWSTTQPWGLFEFDTNDTSGAGSGPVAGVGCRFEGTGGGNASLCFYTDGSNDNDTVLGAANERMCIDHDGRVGIGTTDPSHTVHVKTAGSIRVALDTDADYSSYVSGGSMFVNNPSTSGGYEHFIMNNATAGSHSTTYFSFRRDNGQIGSILTSTGATISFNTGSDYRLKENIVPMPNEGLAVINNLRPKTFNFKTNPTETVYGFIAHELQEHIPMAVSGEKDEMRDIGNVVKIDDESSVEQEDVREPEFHTEGTKWVKLKEEPMYQGVDASKIVPWLVKAVQELYEENQTLKTRLDALESA